MITIDLPIEVEHELEKSAAERGVSREAWLKEIVLEYLEDLKDYQIAEERMQQYDPNTEKTLEEVEKALGLDY